MEVSWRPFPATGPVQDPRRRLGQRPDGAVRRAPVGRGLRLAVVDQDGCAARAPTGFHVLPPITDHEARREVAAVLGRGPDQEPRAGLAAIACVAIVVIADEQVVERCAARRAALIASATSRRCVPRATSFTQT